MSGSRLLFAPLSPRHRYYEASYIPPLPVAQPHLESNHRDYEHTQGNQSWPEQQHSYSSVIGQGGYGGETVQTTRKGRWSPQEDHRLISGIQRFGANRQVWKEVAEQVGTRTGDQCWKRWNDSLNPRLKHSQWTSAEDAILEEAVLRCGRMWSKIASDSLPGRSGLACKNRWDHIQRKQRRLHQSERQSLQQQQERQDVPLHPYSMPQYPKPYHAFAAPRLMTHSRQFSTFNSVPYRPLESSFDSRSTIFEEEEQDSSGEIQDRDSSEEEQTHEEVTPRMGKEEIEEEEDELDQDEESLVASHVDIHLRPQKEAYHDRLHDRHRTPALPLSDYRIDHDTSASMRERHRISTFQQFDDAKPLFLREPLYPTLSSNNTLLPMPKIAHPKSFIEPRNYPASWYPTTAHHSSLIAPHRLAIPSDTQAPFRSLSSSGPMTGRLDYFADANDAIAKGEGTNHFRVQDLQIQSSLSSSSSNNLLLKPSDTCTPIKQEEDHDNYQWLSSIYQNEQHNDEQAGEIDHWQGQTSSDFDNASQIADWSTSLEEDNFDQRYNHALTEPFYPHIFTS